MTVPAPVTTAGAPLTSVGTTLAEFIEEIGDETGNRDDIGDPEITRAVNRAYLNLASMVTLKELKSSLTLPITQDEIEYALPIQVSSIIRIALIDDSLLDGGYNLAMTDEQGYRMLPDAEAGYPTTYVRIGRVVNIWPAPNADWDATLDFKIRPDNLVNSTDSPLLPPEFHEVIMLMGKARIWRMVRNRAASVEAQNDALSVLRPLQNTDAEEMDGAVFGVQPITKRSQMRGLKPRYR